MWKKISFSRVLHGDLPSTCSTILTSTYQNKMVVYQAIHRAKRNRLRLCRFVGFGKYLCPSPTPLVNVRDASYAKTHDFHNINSGFNSRLGSQSLFVMATQIILNAAGSQAPEAYKGVVMPPMKAFMDDTA